MSALFPHMRECVRVTVTKVVVLEGAGTHDDICRLVTYFFDDEGQLLAKHDEAPSIR